MSRSGRPNADRISLAAGRKAAASSAEDHARISHSRESGNPSLSRPTMGPRFRGDDADFRLSRQLKSREQSENVYENKGQVQKVAESGSADRRFCGLRLPHGCWVRPQTANTAVRATPVRLQNRGNKARMYMKAKDKYKMSLSSSAPIRTRPSRVAGPRAATRAAPTSHLRFQSLMKMRFLYSQKQSSQSMPQTTRLVTIAAWRGPAQANRPMVKGLAILLNHHAPPVIVKR